MVQKDSNKNVPGLLLHVKENVCIKLVKSYCFSEENQVIALNLVFLTKCSFFLGIYKPPVQNDLFYQS